MDGPVIKIYGMKMNWNVWAKVYRGQKFHLIGMLHIAYQTVLECTLYALVLRPIQLRC